MTPSDLYSIVKDVEHVWGSVVVHDSYVSGSVVQHSFRLAMNGGLYTIAPETAAALIRDCLARWGHERGLYLGRHMTGNREWFWRVYDSEGEEVGKIIQGDYLAALVAMVKEAT